MRGPGRNASDTKKTAHITYTSVVGFGCRQASKTFDNVGRAATAKL